MNPNNIVSPQQNVPPQQPVINQPTPPVVPERKSHILLWLIIIVLVVILGGVGYYFYSRKTTTTNVVKNTGSDIGPINDSDLRVPVDTVVVDCSVVNSLVATSSDELTNYVTSTSTAKASVSVQNIIKKYSMQINTYIKGGDWTKTATLPSADNSLCSLMPIRTIVNIALANAKYLAENKKSANAETIIAGVLNTTQQIQNNAGSMIGFLITKGVRENTINLLLSLKSRGLIDVNSYISVLAQYSDNKVGLQKVWQNEYSRDAQTFDDLASGDYNTPLVLDMFDSPNTDALAQFQKEKTLYTFEPNNTKLLFYSYFKNNYVNAGLPCGSTTNVTLPNFDLSTSSENYIGKTFYSNIAYSIGADGLSKIRCTLEAKFSQLISTSTAQIAVNPTDDQVANQIVDWKKYSSSAAGIQFQYPSNYCLQSQSGSSPEPGSVFITVASSNSCSYLGSQDQIMQIGINPSTKFTGSLANWEKGITLLHKGTPILVDKHITIGGEDAVLVSPGAGDSNSSIIYTIHNNKAYIINLQFPDSDALKKIVASIEFT